MNHLFLTICFSLATDLYYARACPSDTQAAPRAQHHERVCDEACNHSASSALYTSAAASTTMATTMASPEEATPLRVSVNSDGPAATGANQLGTKISLGGTAAYLIILSVFCLPPMIRWWHPTFYPTLDVEEQRGWTWLGANSLWLALALLWTLLHLDNGPCVATACLLCSLLWVYLLAVLLSQTCRGQLPLLAVIDGVVCVVMLGVCLRTAWAGVAQKSRKARSDGSATWRRVFRKWALVSASLTFLVSCVLGRLDGFMHTRRGS